jgi:hypothetical protein
VQQGRQSRWALKNRANPDLVRASRAGAYTVAEMLEWDVPPRSGPSLNRDVGWRGRIVGLRRYIRFVKLSDDDCDITSRSRTGREGKEN